jgi:hypothetical protein
VFLPRRAVELGLGPGGYGFLVAATTAGVVTVMALPALVLARNLLSAATGADAEAETGTDETVSTGTEQEAGAAG